MTDKKRAGSPSRWTELIDRLRGRDASVGVVGLGYVGLPVAVAFAEAGFRVLGVDVDEARLEPLRQGMSYLGDVADDRLRPLVEHGQLEVTASYEGLAELDAILICVPTPLIDGRPDLSPINAAASGVADVLTKDTLVILESTTYPGTTDELLTPALEAKGLSAGKDFLVAFSPERIDPGNPNYSFEDIPKIVGGIDAASTRAAEALYSQVVPKVITVSSPREAEMAKLIENTYRHVNIALVNELATYAHEWDVDIWEAIEAAATKPFGFMPFWPGPGWGGHCIPLDPSYLSWRVRRDHTHDIRFVELAHTVNAEMPRHVVERISDLLNDRGKSVRNSKILAVGVAYKGGTEDTRGSSATVVLEILAKRGAKIAYHDPLVEQLEVGSKELRSTALSEKMLEGQDLVVLLTRQEGVDWDLVVRGAPVVFDCCRATKSKKPKIVRL
jgi:UDP-N-acetyl-D-glucosamine dehydrogenase